MESIVYVSTAISYSAGDAFNEGIMLVAVNVVDSNTRFLWGVD
jgi:hypothetical protein